MPQLRAVAERPHPQREFVVCRFKYLGARAVDHVMVAGLGMADDVVLAFWLHRLGARWNCCNPHHQKFALRTGAFVDNDHVRFSSVLRKSGSTFNVHALASIAVRISGGTASAYRRPVPHSTRRNFSRPTCGMSTSTSSPIIGSASRSMIRASSSLRIRSQPTISQAALRPSRLGSVSAVFGVRDFLSLIHSGGTNTPCQKYRSPTSDLIAAP